MPVSRPAITAEKLGVFRMDMPVSPSDSGYHYRIFISRVTGEFGRVSEELASDLRKKGIAGKIQIDFRQEEDTATTLDKLEKYVREADAVIALVGVQSGSYPPEAAAKRWAHLLPVGITRATYTQWEVHFGRAYSKRLSFYFGFRERDGTILYPAESAPEPATDYPAGQSAHALWLTDTLGLDRQYFTSADSLCRQVLTESWPEFPRIRPTNLPYTSLGTLFKGRDAFLTDLHESLTGHAATLIKGHAIHGLGGVGKTRAAVEYAWRYQSHYTALLFVSADSPDTLDTKLAALCHADVLNLPEKSLTDQSEQKAAVLNWLNAHPGWLIILDNADTEDALAAVDQLLPKLSGGHILVTSRMTDYAGGIDAVALDVISDDDAAAFLLERTADHRTKAPDDNARALELARELDGLALALEQAAAHMRKERLSFAAYLDLWHNNTAAALHWYNARTMHYPRSLAVTYQTSVDQLSEPAKEFFRVLSWFAPDPIPFSALESDCAPTAARVHFSELENLSLARRNADGTSFSLHRLVQEITRQQQPAPPPPPALLTAVLWINKLFPEEIGDVRAWPVAELLAPHAHSVALHAATHKIREHSSRLLNQVALLYQAKAQHHAAEPLIRRSLALAEADFGKNHPIVAIALSNLADLLHETSRLKEAEPLMRRALAIDVNALGLKHPNTATRLNNLAQLLLNTNRAVEAEPLLVRVVEILMNQGGDPYPNFGAAMNSLARLLKDTNRPVEAESLYRKALMFDEELYGPEHPRIANTLNNLAMLLHDNNRLTEAEPLMRRGLGIEEKKGKDHPHVAIHLNNLAHLLRDDNRLSEAEPLMRRHLEIFVASTRTSGHDHSHLKDGIENYHHLLIDMGDTQAEAEDKINKILTPVHEP